MGVIVFQISITLSKELISMLLLFHLLGVVPHFQIPFLALSMFQTELTHISLTSSFSIEGMHKKILALLLVFIKELSQISFRELPAINGEASDDKWESSLRMQNRQALSVHEAVASLQ
jgi:hypothetical protein